MLFCANHSSSIRSANINKLWELRHYTLIAKKKNEIGLAYQFVFYFTDAENKVLIVLILKATNSKTSERKPPRSTRDNLVSRTSDITNWSLNFSNVFKFYCES